MLDRSGYFAEDTITALATPAGGAIVVLRISGPATRAILRTLTGQPETAPRRATLQTLRTRDGRVLDQAVVTSFKAPSTYTGEDLAEVSLHGSPYLAQAVLEETIRLGARQAMPGEFTFRAVRNGKLTLDQAQAVADLVASLNPSAADLALEKLAGSQGRKVEAIAAGLRETTVLSELGIDFSDQDIDEVSLQRLRDRVRQVITELRHLEETFDRGQRIQEGVPTVFLGAPNSGKSSLFNALVGEERSIVSGEAGTTRDVVHERLTLRSPQGHLTLRLQDTAGLRAAEQAGEVEGQGIQRSKKAAAASELWIFVWDPTAPEAANLAAWKGLGDLPRPSGTVGAQSKADLHASFFPESLKSQTGIPHWIQISSLTGSGLAQLTDQIVRVGSQSTSRRPGEVLLTRPNQLHAVREARSTLERATEAPDCALLASDLRHALHLLAPLIGATPTDDLLASIFSEFCIGK